jgi:hypothetical protein
VNFVLPYTKRSEREFERRIEKKTRAPEKIVKEEVEEKLKKEKKKKSHLLECITPGFIIISMKGNIEATLIA